ncbi:3-oxoacyl-[acyl-carrier-protein] synthase I, chloroplastic-like [Zingiber officinale]|uniref:3-oxoacyl-[acyl-carrier-protein] synthase I, chloroplastic-like n=1 Tax=Zingiber officinale TaxID=94328 RepID=UPI001C4CB316|nr:3-oxoacyl-[acyl-carrier-protein] synthase I, chloroplastic-like [Zingiber officinale]
MLGLRLPSMDGLRLHSSSPLPDDGCRRAGVSRRILAVRASAAAPRRQADPKKQVVVTGMGLVSVFGYDIETYYEKLLQGESGIRLIDRFDASKLPTRFAGQIRGFSSEGYIDGKNDRRMDDCLRYCLVSGKKVLESAGLGVGSEALSKICLSFVVCFCGT